MTALDRDRPAELGRWAVLGLIALALLARALAVVRGAGLVGDIGYDDGVYFGAAVALVHGAMPYRDVLLLHPPGILVLLSPFAAIGALTNDGTGLAVARVAFILLGVANTLLVARLASTHGRAAGILAGVLYATWHAAAGFERTTLLVPAQTALLLLALLSLEAGRANAGRVSARRQILAGAALGFATAIQLWAVVPLGVIGAWLAVRGRSRAERTLVPIRYAVAALGTFAVVVLPFLAATGGSMIRQVLLDQLGRPNNLVSLSERLRTLEGLGQVQPHLPSVVPLGAAVAGAAVVVWVARRSPETRIFAVLFAVMTAVILLTPVSFPHYSAWPAPAGAVTFGVAGALILERFARRNLRQLAIVGYAGLTAILLIPDVGRAGAPLPLAALANDTAGARCVAADEPILLIELSRIGPEIARGCPIIVDPTGIAYDVDRGLLTAGTVVEMRSRAANFQRAMLAYYGSADAAMVVAPTAIGLTAPSWAAIRCHLPIQLQHSSIQVLLPNTSGPPPACPG